MIKNRLGEDVFKSLEGNLEVKAHEASRKDYKKGRKGDKKERPQRQKERK